MKKIKLFNQFISEEIVTGLSSTYNNITTNLIKNIDKKDANVFKDTFNNDILKLKEFIQFHMKNQNLKFIGSGSIGLAFEWLESKPLDDTFYTDIIGEKTFDNLNKVIKFTTVSNEIEGAKKLIEKNSTKNLAKYFWIKKINLPPQNWWSKLLGPQTPEEKTKYPLKNKPHIKSRIQSLKYTLGDKEVDELFKKYQSFKKDSKLKIAYLICIEKVSPITLNQKTIANTLQELYLYKKYNPTTSNKQNLELVWNNLNISSAWKNIVNMRLEQDHLKDNFTNITKQEFIDFGLQYIEVYKSLYKLDIPINDIHGGNLGWRNNELVTFDVM